jgi:hypothetical protein
LSQAPHRLLAIARYVHGVPGDSSSVFCGLSRGETNQDGLIWALGVAPYLPALPPQPCVVSCAAVVWNEGGVGGADFLSAAMFFFNLLVLMLMLLLTQRALAGTIAQNSAYQACISYPSTCTQLCVPPSPSPGRVSPRTRKRWPRAFRQLAVDGVHGAPTPSFVRW